MDINSLNELLKLFGVGGAVIAVMAMWLRSMRSDLEKAIAAKETERAFFQTELEKERKNCDSDRTYYRQTVQALLTKFDTQNDVLLGVLTSNAKVMAEFTLAWSEAFKRLSSDKN